MVSPVSSKQDALTGKSGDNKVLFPALQADSFRHPIDLLSTKILKGLIGVDYVTRRILNPLIEKLFLLENLSFGIRVTEKQLPDLYTCLSEACQILDIKPPYPELFLRQNPYPNAYTLAFQGERPFIVLHTALLDLLNTEELQVVLAHELGHLKCEHGVWLTIANSLSVLWNSLGPIGLPISTAIERQLVLWFRAAEFSCDRASLLVSQNPSVVICTLMKLSGGSYSSHQKLDAEEYIRQAEDFTRESQKSILSKIISRQLMEAVTHPLPVLRAIELKRWSQSNEYVSLLKNGKPFLK
eukprot:jgi/Galph1/131/GphlegSOOS_G4833.1